MTRVRLSHVVVGFAFAVAIVEATPGSSDAASSLPAPHFLQASGWIVRKPSSQPTSSVVAVTIRDRAVAHPFAPFVGFKRLSPRGIIVWATTLGRNRSGFRRLRWPLRLSIFRVDRGWEGQPAPNIQQRLIFGAVDGWDLDVRVYFATQKPDKRLLKKAQRQLWRLRLPSGS
jgi:hypothetical protein